jgi:hypothetical protein
VVGIVSGLATAAAAGEASGFWGEQRRGANFFNKVETRAGSMPPRPSASISCA